MKNDNINTITDNQEILDSSSQFQVSNDKLPVSSDNYKSKFNTCVGPSMYPTLRSGDGLILYTYTSTDDVSIGDIIVYPHPNKPFDVVHRIINKLTGGVITRGDNNNKIDPYIITYDNIIGKVISVKRKDQTIILLSGKKGLLLHKYLIIRMFTLPYIRRPIGFTTRLIEKNKIFNFCDFLFQVDVVSIKSGNNKKYILRHKNKVIGIKSEKTDNQWQIKFPYKLFIKKDKILLHNK